MAKDLLPIATPRFPEPNSDPPDRRWCDAFLRALTSEFSKTIQPIGTRYLVTGFSVPTRSFTGPAARTATCQVGTVTVQTNGPRSALVRLLDAAEEKSTIEPRTTPANTGDVLATLIRDLQTRGWLS